MDETLKLSELWSANKAARACGMHTTTFLRSVKAGKGPKNYEVPGVRRMCFVPAEVLAWNRAWRGLPQ